MLTAACSGAKHCSTVSPIAKRRSSSMRHRSAMRECTAGERRQQQRRVGQRVAHQGRCPPVAHEPRRGQEGAQLEGGVVEVLVEHRVRREEHLEAVVEAEAVVHGGAHPPAHFGGRLEHHHVASGPLQLDGRNEAGDAGADDDDGGLAIAHAGKRTGGAGGSVETLRPGQHDGLPRTARDRPSHERSSRR